MKPETNITNRTTLVKTTSKKPLRLRRAVARDDTPSRACEDASNRVGDPTNTNVGKQILFVRGYKIEVQSHFASQGQFYNTGITLNGTPSPGSRVKSAILIFRDFPAGGLPKPQYDLTKDMAIIYYPSAAMPGILTLLESSALAGPQKPFPLYCVYRDDFPGGLYADLHAERTVAK